MWILAPKGHEDEGAYAVRDAAGQKVVFLFEERDDCERYGIQLEAKDHPDMEIIQVQDTVAITACERANVKYTIISPDDIVIPVEKND
tara:strand:- start:364 stop:627 length:264 start_codon:yes stop_codon:yes gene_type:complete